MDWLLEFYEDRSRWTFSGFLERNVSTRRDIENITDIPPRVTHRRTLRRLPNDAALRKMTTASRPR
jgi:hypothetical protein